MLIVISVKVEKVDVTSEDIKEGLNKFTLIRNSHQMYSGEFLLLMMKVEKVLELTSNTEISWEQGRSHKRTKDFLAD